MCGIVGFTGNHQASSIFLDGLSKLEHKGYDFADIAVCDGEKKVGGSRKRQAEIMLKRVTV